MALVLRRIRPRGLHFLRQLFDARWYASFYGVHLAPPQRDLFEHYLTVGAHAGFSPSPTFDEVAYRAAHPDVAEAIASGAYLCGHHHYVLNGVAEGRRSYVLDDSNGSTYRMHGEVARVVRRYFDPRWYAEAHGDVARALTAGTLVSPLWHYLVTGSGENRSPNAWFDEPWYLGSYPDVAEAKADGRLPSGFFHYLQAGRREGRLPNSDPQPGIQEIYPGVAKPVGLDRLGAIERKLAAFPFRVFPARGQRRVNVLVPTLDRNLLFAGYIAALNFISSLQSRGWTVRILVFEDVNSHAQRSPRQFPPESLVARVLARAEIINLARRSEVLGISSDDRFVAYSMWGAHHAHVFAAAVGRRFTFFIQEFEPAFHHHDSWHALGASAYRLPHFAMFNSEPLRRYFARERLGVFAGGEVQGSASSVVFEHALAVPRPPQSNELVRDTVRRLLFYARPEAHGARNLFEIGVVGLRRAVAAGVFDADEWLFHGVGTLATTAKVRLGAGKQLTLAPRLELDDYARALRGFEVGLSLQYAPHPGVVAFEMAASGMVVVTNTFSNRSAAELVAQSANLVPVEPTPESVACGLAEAVSRSRDVGACIRGAQGPWVTSWDQSFSDHVMRAVEAELA